jgi:hypothetical protein
VRAGIPRGGLHVLGYRLQADRGATLVEMLGIF